jgi:hypothetical protein
MIAAATVLTQFVTSAAGGAQVRLEVIDGTGAPVPARIHLQDAAGKAVKPPGLPAWHDHFVCAGAVEISVPPGRYRVEAERGPEFTAALKNFTVGSADTNIRLAVRRIADLANEGWWSGETHVHRSTRDAELLMRAEDLHVGQFITWWNRTNPRTNSPLPGPVPVPFDGNRFYHPIGGEDERDGGALLFLDLAAAIDITGGARHFPSSLLFAKQARERGAKWIDAEKPFWWDFPMWVAQGVVDTVGIAHNHMNRGGVLDNEAWGRARDRGQYSEAAGNGIYTQDIYYRLLNTGVRLPPSAGSASGVLPNPVGYNRVYVYLPRSSRGNEAQSDPKRGTRNAEQSQSLRTSAATSDEFTYAKWREGLKAGRSFVSNGPLLRCRANGFFPGHVFQGNQPMEIRIEGKLDSREPVAAVELVQNGRAEKIRLPHRLTVRESGWFLVRAIADVTNTFRFASTAPWYVEMGGQPMKPRADAAQFFLDWSRERMAKLGSLTEVSAAQKEELLQPWRETEAFWARKITNTQPTLVAGQINDSATKHPVPERPYCLVTGEIFDTSKKLIVPARLYIRNERGDFFFAESAVTYGSAVRYDKQSGFNKHAIERHTALSAHPFRAVLPPGRYTFIVERGKEYHTTERIVGVDDTKPVQLRLGLDRFANMAKRGWFSGDTHVHRDPAELATVALAEDLNVVLPMTDWTTENDVPPTRSSRNIKGTFMPRPIVLDPTHVIYPRNTEYEIFRTGGKQHTLGAFLVVNQRERLDLPVMPWRRVAERVRAEGGLIDFEKHNWEWSAALAPIVRPELFELANNHFWRTQYGVTNWAAPAPAWMNVGTGGRSEREWALYGFQAWYALLNCGFNPRPTAGTAHGVHPVPLGYGRVYVHLDKGFSYEAWLRALEAGRSFVTTGPMLLAEVDGELPGHRFTWKTPGPRSVTVKTRIIAPRLEGMRIEFVVNSEVVKQRDLAHAGRSDVLDETVRERIEIPESGWLAVRCWQAGAGGRFSFAHTAAWSFDLGGAPVRPRKHEVEWLAERVREEIARNRPLLPAELLHEYEEALAFYERLLRHAR